MKTVDLYKEIYEQTPEFIKQTFSGASDSEIQKAIVLLKKAKRIIFTASGSSIPPAMLGASYLQLKAGLPAFLVPTSYILDSDTLSEDDVVVFVSQGWNRADALFISQKIEQSKATLIGITANPTGEHAKKAHSHLIFYPSEEELFCRPTSVISSYLLVAKMVLAVTGERLDEEKALKAFLSGKEKGEKDHYQKSSYYVVLSSGMGMPGAYNIGLALREGGGKLGITYDIETYGHGWYVPDQIYRSKGGSFHYIILTHGEDIHTQKAAKRILPMIKATQSSYSLWETEYDSIYGNVEALARITPWIIHFNKEDDYDMNHPPGMEENRGYHDNIDYFSK